METLGQNIAHDFMFNIQNFFLFKFEKKNGKLIIIALKRRRNE